MFPFTFSKLCLLCVHADRRPNITKKFILPLFHRKLITHHEDTIIEKIKWTEINVLLFLPKQWYWSLHSVIDGEPNLPRFCAVWLGNIFPKFRGIATNLYSDSQPLRLSRYVYSKRRKEFTQTHGPKIQISFLKTETSWKLIKTFSPVSFPVGSAVSFQQDLAVSSLSVALSLSLSLSLACHISDQLYGSAICRLWRTGNVLNLIGRC
jgi:hypothetical protein